MTMHEAPTKPVIDYARGIPPPGILARIPGEVWAVALVAVSACVGWWVNLRTGKDGPGPLFIPGVVVGVVWYVIARLRRRTSTRTVWKVQLVLATLVCIAGAAFVAFDTDGHVEHWRRYNGTRAAVDVIGSGVAWFALVEVAAWVDRRVTRRRRRSSCPPVAHAR
jgi:hypothetical protein